MIKQLQASSDHNDESRPIAKLNHLDEYYTALLRRVRAARDGLSEVPRAIGVTGCRRSVGVSTVSAHLAIASAQLASQRTLLIDANVTRPSVAATFAQAKSPGLVELLLEKMEPEECIQSTRIPGLSVITAGALYGTPINAVEPTHVARHLDSLKHRFDSVIVDMPATNDASMCFSLIGGLDAVLLIIEAGHDRPEVAMRAKRQLIEARAHILGIVFNKWKNDMPSWLL